MTCPTTLPARAADLLPGAAADQRFQPILEAFVRALNDAHAFAGLTPGDARSVADVVAYDITPAGHPAEGLRRRTRSIGRRITRCDCSDS